MDIKELEALIKLCRKTGVINLTLEGVSLTLAPEAPQSPYKRRSNKVALTPFEQALAEAKDTTTKAKLKYMAEQAGQQLAPPTDAPDELAMLLWSAGGGDGAQS